MLAMYKGIDVSEHQGKIDWKEASQHIDFAILRAGYGRKHLDEQFLRNVNECEHYGVPYGAYWFSYAIDNDLAFEEANFLCSVLKDYNPTMPICFDYEYDSYEWGKKQDAHLDYNTVIEMTETFLSHVESQGFYAMMYTNMDWLNRCFWRLTQKYDTWLAFWGTDEPSRKYGIHQYSSTGRIPGINGDVDLNKTSYNYPEIIKNMRIAQANKKKPVVVGEKTKRDIMANLTNEWWAMYINIAKQYCNGFYGKGIEGLAAIAAEGYDVEIIRAITAVIKGER